LRATAYRFLVDRLAVLRPVFLVERLAVFLLAVFLVVGISKCSSRSAPDINWHFSSRRALGREAARPLFARAGRVVKLLSWFVSHRVRDRLRALEQVLCKCVNRNLFGTTKSRGDFFAL
jgi:hypothetical protein